MIKLYYAIFWGHIPFHQPRLKGTEKRDRSVDSTSGVASPGGSGIPEVKAAKKQNL